MKNSINQIKNTVESITKRVDQAEEIIAGTEDEVKEILHSDNNKEKNKHEHKSQRLWGMTETKPNIHGIKEGAEIQTQCKETYSMKS
jgi:hypothetical protein